MHTFPLKTKQKEIPPHKKNTASGAIACRLSASCLPLLLHRPTQLHEHCTSAIFVTAIAMTTRASSVVPQLLLTFLFCLFFLFSLFFFHFFYFFSALELYSRPVPLGTISFVLFLYRTHTLPPVNSSNLH